jgi:hypothetical protein
MRPDRTAAWRLLGATLVLVLAGCSAAGAQGAADRLFLPVVDRQVADPGPPTVTPSETATFVPTAPVPTATPNPAQEIRTAVAATQTRAAIYTAVSGALTATAAVVNPPTATATPTSCVPFFCTPTPTSTPTPTGAATATSTATAIATPTRPPFEEIAAGSAAATASSAAAGHPPAAAVDLVGGTGAPRAQNEETYWQAGVAPAQGSESWTVDFAAPGITLVAIQARLYMPSAALLAVYATLTRSAGGAGPQTLLFDGTASDRQVVGADYGASGVSNVTQVRLIFTRPDVAPGLRTVGVYRLFASASSGLGVLAAIVNWPGRP